MSTWPWWVRMEQTGGERSGRHYSYPIRPAALAEPDFIAVRVRIRYENIIENQRAEPYFCIESE